MSTAEKVAVLENRISELEQENKRLHDTVEYLTRKLFGRSSEKTSALALGQISLFDEAEIQADPNNSLLWEPILRKIQPGFITECRNAIEWSHDIARKFLASNMFSADVDAKRKVSVIIEKLTEKEEGITVF